MSNERTLYAEYAELDSAAAAAEWIVARSGDGMQYRLLESYASSDFQKVATAQANELEKTFAGRLFGPEAEIRWRRDGEKWHVWRLSEGEPGTGPGGATAVRCRKAEEIMHYYMLGVWRKGKYSEPHLKEMRGYPIQDPAENSRARLEVWEYFAARHGYEDPVDALNQPRLVAYRIAGVSAGWDGKPKKVTA